MTDKEVIEIIRAYADIKKKYENLLSALDEILKNEKEKKYRRIKL